MIREACWQSLYGIALALVLSTGCTEERINPACGSECFPGLSAEVELRRDAAGVVHVYGLSDADVFYGSGYAQATDRLFQMDITRRQALGRRAEVLGERYVGDDALLRTIGIAAMGEANADLMRIEQPETYALLVAWIAGVNARIDDVHTGIAPMPYGFAELDYAPERWTPADAMAVGKLVLFGNANQIEYELLATILRDFFPEVAENFPLLMPLAETYSLPAADRPVAQTRLARQSERGPAKGARRRTHALPPDASARFRDFSRRMAVIRPGASNNWAVRGEHTENGRSLIAGDPHQGLRSPSLMWAHHLNSMDGGGSLDVAGFSFVGSPTIQLGHNRHLAWTATTNYPDTMDLLSVPVVNGVAMIGGVPVELATTVETITVRDAASVDVVIERVPGLGVLLSDDLPPIDITEGDDRILLTWPGFEATNDGYAFLQFDLAADLTDFEAAVEAMEIGNFNFVAATADGILYRSAPRVPARPWASDDKPPFALLDGKDPAVQWNGTWMSPALLPRSEGAARGWLATANNDPFGFTSDGKVDGDPFYFGMFFDAGTRAMRVESELTRLVSLGSVTREQMQDLQMDTHTVLADLLLPLLDAAWNDAQTDPALAPFRDRTDLANLTQSLSAWDRRMNRESEAALAFHAFMSFTVRRTVEDDLTVAFDALYDANTIFVIKMALLALTDRFEGAAQFVQEGRSLILLSALDDAATFLKDRGSDTTWSGFHVTEFSSLWSEALDGGKHQTDGADGTVNVSSGKFFDGDGVVEQHTSGGGAIFRLVTGFDDDGVPRATMNYPRGNSGEPNSPYFDNTLEDWIEGRYQPYLFRTTEVEDGSELIDTLSPVKPTMQSTAEP